VFDEQAFNDLSVSLRKKKNDEHPRYASFGANARDELKLTKQNSTLLSPSKIEER